MTTGVGIQHHSHSLSEVNYGWASLVGIIATLAMAVFVMPVGALLGFGFFSVPQGVASLILSEAAAVTVLGTLFGLALPLAFGVIYGIIFAVLYTWLTSDYTYTSAISLGIAFGLLLWVINFVILSTTLTPALLVAAVPMTVSLIAHLIFGGFLGLYGRWH